MDRNLKQHKIYLDAIRSDNSSTGFLIRKKDGEYNELPENDFFVSIHLKKTSYLNDYANISRQQGYDTLERQNFNPFFIEYDFFKDIERNKLINASNLTQQQISFIREMRPDVSVQYETDLDLRNWFDREGLNELPWNAGTSSEVSIEILEKVSINLKNIISKSTIYPIDINN